MGLGHVEPESRGVLLNEDVAAAVQRIVGKVVHHLQENTVSRKRVFGLVMMRGRESFLLTRQPKASFGVFRPGAMDTVQVALTVPDRARFREKQNLPSQASIRRFQAVWQPRQREDSQTSNAHTTNREQSAPTYRSVCGAGKPALLQPCERVVPQVHQSQARHEPAKERSHGHVRHPSGAELDVLELLQRPQRGKNGHAA